tara:strand:+ start:4574 stop:4750 length:177 start_codon:yes stop_codon:yes gene_type:complete
MEIKLSDISGYTKFVNTKFIDDIKEEEPKAEIIILTGPNGDDGDDGGLGGLGNDGAGL